MTDSQSLKSIIEQFRMETRTEFAEVTNELTIEIRKIRIWIVATFFAGGGLMIAIAKIFFSK